jgi:hypothetical protein
MKQFILVLVLVTAALSQYKPMVLKNTATDNYGARRSMYLAYPEQYTDSLIPVVNGEKALAFMRLDTDKGGYNIIMVKHIASGTFRYYFEKNLISVERMKRETFNFVGM